MLKVLIPVFALVCVIGFVASGPPTCAPGAQCPSKTIPIWKGFIPCKTDCINQHGATTGTCQANYCCKCGTLTGKKKALSAQCRDVKGDARVGYQELCDADCKCYHGAVGGTCNYANQACVCGADAKENACKYTLAQIQAIAKKYSFPINIIG